MSYRADIFVTEDSPHTQWRIVVEVLQNSRFDQTAQKIVERFMNGMNCPVGLIVSSEGIRLLVDDGDPSGPLLTAEGSLPPSIRSAWNTRAGFEAEAAVQDWLEQLQRDPSRVQELEDPLRTAFQTWLLPELIGTTIRAGYKRDIQTRKSA